MLTDCVLCGSFQGQSIFRAPNFDNANENITVVRCTCCGLGSTEKPLQPMGTFYAEDYYGTQESKFNSIFERLLGVTYVSRLNTITKFLDKKLSSASLLDVGCGRGNFLRQARRRGITCVGVEIPEFSLPKSEDGLTFVHGPLESLELPNESFDIISIWHVLEHVESPQGLLNEAHRLLKTDGLLLVSVPNFGSFQSRFFGKHWFHLDLPRHLFHFTKKSLSQLLSRSDFQIKKVRTHSLDQDPYGFVQSALNRVFPKEPNAFYGMLKVGSRIQTIPFAKKIKHYFVGMLLTPLALAETLFSGIIGTGATLTLVARKK